MHQDTSGARARLRRALRTIEGQHLRLREIHQELDRNVSANNATEAATWLSRLQSALRAHFELEESIVFPILSELNLASVDSVGRLEAEHRAMLSKLDVLLSASVATLESGLPELRHVMSDHESREEKEVRHVLGQDEETKGR